MHWAADRNGVLIDRTNLQIQPVFLPSPGTNTWFASHLIDLDTYNRARPLGGTFTYFPNESDPIAR